MMEGLGHVIAGLMGIFPLAQHVASFLATRGAMNSLHLMEVELFHVSSAGKHSLAMKERTLVTTSSVFVSLVQSIAKALPGLASHIPRERTSGQSNSNTGHREAENPPKLIMLWEQKIDGKRFPSDCGQMAVSSTFLQ